MNDTDMVSHDGTVIAVNGSHVQVKIVSQSACAECRAKRFCTAADMQEKIIDAIAHDSLERGDAVTINMEKRVGWLALFYGFLLPFIVLAAVLFLFYALGSSETRAALFALASLVPYYLGLYVFRKKIEKDFIFIAEKKNKV
jgi:sigma-E factor negative regulatory protein RseC